MKRSIRSMRVHYVQHVPFEGLGSMANYFGADGFELSASQLYAGDSMPHPDQFDLLIVMGGPMGVSDVAQYPWLVEEKRGIANAIECGKRVLGICLGAQLIAEVAGARIYPNVCREIGWFPIQHSSVALATSVGHVLPEELTVFHWHGDTFDLPAGATQLASSEACENQGFIMDNRVLALQFHLESTRRSIADLIKNCSKEIDGSTYTQSTYEIIDRVSLVSEINVVMSNMLTALIVERDD